MLLTRNFISHLHSGLSKDDAVECLLSNLIYLLPCKSPLHSAYTTNKIRGHEYRQSQMRNFALQINLIYLNDIFLLIT